MQILLRIIIERGKLHRNKSMCMRMIDCKTFATIVGLRWIFFFPFILTRGGGGGVMHGEDRDWSVECLFFFFLFLSLSLSEYLCLSMKGFSSFILIKLCSL